MITKFIPITNPDDKCEGRASPAINILLAINTHHHLLHATLTQQVLFSIEPE